MIKQTSFQTVSVCVQTSLAVVMLSLYPAHAWEKGGPSDDGYTEEPFFLSRTNPGRDFDFGPVGVSGLVIDIKKGKFITVRETTPSTPAADKFRPGEILTAVNRKSFAGRDPQQVMGLALTEAEANDDRLVFEVMAGEGKRKATISIPVAGPYSSTWPLNCAKSDRIIKQAAAYYGGDAFIKGRDFAVHNVEGALGCLFLLSTDDDAHLPMVKAYLSATRVDGSNWMNGYNGILCAAYFQRTGDKAVLSLLQGYCDAAKVRQKFNSGWNHGGISLSPNYVSGGLLNAAGNQVRDFSLPATLWGTPADLIFHSVKPIERFMKLAADEPTHRPFFRFAYC